MKKVFAQLPNWTFDLNEVSADVYQVIATHVAGCCTEVKGTEPDKIMEQAIVNATKMETDFNKFRIIRENTKQGV